MSSTGMEKTVLTMHAAETRIQDEGEILPELHTIRQEWIRGLGKLESRECVVGKTLLEGGR